MRSANEIKDKIIDDIENEANLHANILSDLLDKNISTKRRWNNCDIEIADSYAIIAATAK